MIVNRILIIDFDNGDSGEYRFKSGPNLLVSADNSQGKSSLLKSMYYALGLDIKHFPSGWNPTKMIIKLDLYNERTGKNVFVIRRGDLFYVSGEEESLTPSGYTKWLSNELGVDLKLTLRNTKITGSISRPSALITPFYVDQDESWSGRLYSSLNEVNMYADTPQRIIEYLLNISDDDRMKAHEKLSKLKSKMNDVKAKRNNLDEVYMKYVDNNSVDQLQLMSDIKSPIEGNERNVENFINLMDEANKKYVEYKAARVKLQRDLDQKRQSAEEYNTVLKMLRSDYEVIKSICKHCKSELTKEQVRTRLEVSTNIYELTHLISLNNHEIDDLELKIKDVIGQEKIANDEYKKLSVEVNTNTEMRSIAEYIDDITTKKSQDEFAAIIQDLDTEIGTITSDISDVNSNLRESKKKVAELTEKISHKYLQYIHDLSLIMKGSNVDQIEFNKYGALKSSGVNENQAYLGAYLTYIKLISEFGRYKLPFCIDSFIKNETSPTRLDAMFKATEKYLMSVDGQSIFSAIEDSVDRHMGDISSYNRVDIGGKLLSADKFKSSLAEVDPIITLK